MVVVLDRHEAERLQTLSSACAWGSRTSAMACTGPACVWNATSTKSPASQAMGHPEQAAGHGNGLEFCFGAAAVF